MTRSTMKISVITVCFNSAATIVDTLKSVELQTHDLIEHIVVDGASRDATVGLVRNNGPRVARLSSEPDTGIYDAMNKGLAMATGDMVGFLNADDVFASADAVAQIAAAASAPQPPDAVFGDLVYVDPDDLNRVIRCWRSGAFAARRLRFGWMPPHPTFYARTELLRHIGGFDTRFHIAGDYDCMLRCLNRPDIRAAYIENVLVRMRTGGASNRSLAALLQKSTEDLRAIRANAVGGLFTLCCKTVRKVPQLWQRHSSHP